MRSNGYVQFIIHLIHFRLMALASSKQNKEKPEKFYSSLYLNKNTTWIHTGNMSDTDTNHLGLSIV